MSVRFNSSGDRLLCLSRREPPKVYQLYGEGEIQLRAEGYNNACTMKSCCFAGDRDEYAISGSDDHNIYVWKVPTTCDDDNQQNVVHDAHMILRDHRSVVNHVRYNPATCSLASCGVEKMVKVKYLENIPTEFLTSSSIFAVRFGLPSLCPCPLEGWIEHRRKRRNGGSG